MWRASRHLDGRPLLARPYYCLIPADFSRYMIFCGYKCDSQNKRRYACGESRHYRCVGPGPLVANEFNLKVAALPGMIFDRR
jgi:hypothetical protein